MVNFAKTNLVNIKSRFQLYNNNNNNIFFLLTKRKK